MKVLLVQPPVWNYYRGMRLHLNPNLGILYLAAMIRDKHEVRVYDCEALQWTSSDLLKAAHAFGATVVGITGTTIGFPSMVAMTKHLKDDGLKVLVGGPHVTYLGDRALQATGADVAVIGEGESVMEEALHSQGGTILYGTPLKMSELPSPARDLLTPTVDRGYVGNQPLYKRPETAVQWERGCPHGCYFCSHPVHGNKPTRFREPGSIVEELKHLKDRWHIKTVFVYDDELFGLSQKQSEWLHVVLDAIIQADLGLIMKTQARCSKALVTQDLADKMYEAGFRAVMLGCESGSPKVLEASRKGTTVEDIMHTVRIVHSSGMHAWGYWMVGNLEETVEDAAMTEKLIKKLKPYMQFRQVTICTPWAGSKTRELAVQGGWIFEQNPLAWLADRPVMDTPWMNRHEMDVWRTRLAAA